MPERGGHVPDQGLENPLGPLALEPGPQRPKLSKNSHASVSLPINGCDNDSTLGGLL